MSFREVHFLGRGLGGGGGEQPLPTAKKIPSKPFYRNKDQIIFCKLMEENPYKAFHQAKKKKKKNLKNNLFRPSVGVNIKGKKFSCYRIVH